MVVILNMSRRGGVVPEGAVYVGNFVSATRTRGLALPASKFANPFKVKKYGRRAAVKMFREWIEQRPDLIAAARSELRGHDLACWCAPEACHAEVLEDITR